MRLASSSRVRALVVLALTTVAGLATAGSAAALPYQVGDVFAGVGSDTVEVYRPNGTLVQTLDTNANTTYNTGMCFDSAGNLYSTNFSTANLSKFDNQGALITSNFGAGSLSIPESCAIDLGNNVVVGDLGTGIQRFNSSGTEIDDDAVGRVDWLDLSADQCTVLYTDEGSTIYRHNTCTNTALPDFANGLAAPCFALRIRTNGEVLVACASQVYRLNAAGGVIQTYPAAGFTPSVGFLFALNVDPDGQTFWTADINTGDIYRINIATGAQVFHFNASPNTQLAGLAVFGEQTVGGPQGRGQMVSKGSLQDANDGKVDYAWRVDCALAANGSSRPIEARWPGKVFKKTSTTSVECSDDPAIAYDPPNADFDTMKFEATGTVNGQPGWKIKASKVTDEGAGAGNVNDSVAFTIENPGGTVVIDVAGRPPGPFPGSGQATGQNTATASN